MHQGRAGSLGQRVKSSTTHDAGGAEGLGFLSHSSLFQLDPPLWAISRCLHENGGRGVQSASLIEAARSVDILIILKVQARLIELSLCRPELLCQVPPR
jgi:hypothetical protein